MAENKNPMELLAERDKIFYDFYHNVTPERMPVISALQNPAGAGRGHGAAVLHPRRGGLLRTGSDGVALQLQCPFPRV